MEIICTSCQSKFEAKNSYAKYCSDKCRKRAANRRSNVVELKPNLPDSAPEAAKESAKPAEMASLLTKVRKELEDGGVLDTANGQLALKLAERLELQTNDSGSSLAAVSKELRQVMAEALNKVVAAADPIDELQRRRESRRRA